MPNINKLIDEGVYNHWKHTPDATMTDLAVFRRDLWAEHYKRYMASPEWEKKRAQVRSRAARQGVIDEVTRERMTEDNTLAPREVHHLTYDNFGQERLDELVMVTKQTHTTLKDRDKNKVALMMHKERCKGPDKKANRVEFELDDPEYDRLRADSAKAGMSMRKYLARIFKQKVA